MIETLEWKPLKDDIAMPKFRSIEGKYVVRVISVEDDVVTFEQIKNKRSSDPVTNRIRTFVDRFELLHRDNVIPFPVRKEPEPCTNS